MDFRNRLEVHLKVTSVHVFFKLNQQKQSEQTRSILSAVRPGQFNWNPREKRVLVFYFLAVVVRFCEKKENGSK